MPPRSPDTVRIATLNVNGIRAAVRRGFGDWLARTDPDVVCLQEVRAKAADIPESAFDGYHVAYHEGNLAGRNGVAVLTRQPPTAIRHGFGSAEFDEQGRYIEVDLPGLTVASLYLPKGDVLGERLESKARFMKELAAHTDRVARQAALTGAEYVVSGDYNIAHAEVDLKSWKANLRSVGFLPHERQWMGELVASGRRDGLVDVLRVLHPGVDGPYTWWSWRGKAFDNDSGWRIDLQIATPGLAARAIGGWVDKEPSYAQRLSDHAAVVVDYRIGTTSG